MHQWGWGVSKFTDKDLLEGSIDMPNGYTLFWKENEVGGRTYYSNEIGDGVFVWDTALVNVDTILTAISHEMGLQKYERWKNDQTE